MKPEYYQISWQEFVDAFDWKSFLVYLTSGYGMPVLCAALVFPLVVILKKKPKEAVWAVTLIQCFSIYLLGGIPEVYGGLASGYDLMLISIYVINTVCLLILVGGAYWTMYWTHRYQIGGRIVVVLSVLAWWGRSSMHLR